jgi:hypothetical protein
MFVESKIMQALFLNPSYLKMCVRSLEELALETKFIFPKVTLWG